MSAQHRGKGKQHEGGASVPGRKLVQQGDLRGNVAGDSGGRSMPGLSHTTYEMG